MVNDPRFTLEVLAVALYLNGKPEGWVPRAYDIKKRFDIGKEKWEKISKLMRELGLLHDTHTQNGKELSFEVSCEMKPKEPSKQSDSAEVSQGRKTRPSGNRTVGKPAHIIRKRANNKKDILKNHDHNEIEKEKKISNPQAQKPPMKAREGALSCDEYYIYEKLLSFRGIFPGVALAIVEQYSVGEINNTLEVATREGVKNPGSYVVKCLYKKEAS